MKLQAEEWNQPQICGDCHTHAAEGWQELKYTPGGPHLEKRCAPCAIKHYGKAILDQHESKQETTKAAGKKKGMDDAPLLGQTG